MSGGNDKAIGKWRLISEVQKLQVFRFFIEQGLTGDVKIFTEFGLGLGKNTIHKLSESSRWFSLRYE